MTDTLLAIGADGARGGWLTALAYGTSLEDVHRVELTLAADSKRWWRCGRRQYRWPWTSPWASSMLLRCVHATRRHASS